MSNPIYFDEYDSDDEFYDDTISVKQTLVTSDINNNKSSLIHFQPIQETDEQLELKHAIIHDNLLKVVQILDKSKMNINTHFTNGYTCLLLAVLKSSLDLVKLFIKRGANVNCSSQVDKTTILMYACSASNSIQHVSCEIVKLLIENGACLNDYNKQLMTPLMFASRAGSNLLAKYLIENNAHVNDCDCNGYTSLTHAILNGHLECVYELLNANVDIYTQTFDTRLYPIEISVRNGHKKITKLLEYFFKFNKIDQDFYRKLCLDNDETSLETNLNVDYLKKFLDDLKISELLDLFIKNNISFDKLLTYNHNDLARIGISNEETCTRIVKEIETFHKLNWKSSSLTRMRYKSSINKHELIAILTNLKRQFDFMQSTFKYISREIRQNVLNEVDSDALKNLLNESKESNNKFNIEFLQFITTLKNKLSNGTSKPLDRISYKSNKFEKYLITTGVASLVSFIIFKYYKQL